MTEKEWKVYRAKLEVSEAESRLRECQANLAQGYTNLEAKVAQAKADMEKEYIKLKEEVTRAQLRVDVEKGYLQCMEAEQSRGFEA